MMKMRLGAKVPNEGARRMAWAIARQHGGDIADFADFAQLSISTCERLLDGEIIPGTDLALAVGCASDGFVSRMDWQREPDGRWFDQPSPRPSLLNLVQAA